MNSQNKQHSTNEIQDKLSEDLNKSEVGVALVVSENESVLENKLMDLHNSIESKKIEFNDSASDKQSEKFLRIIPGQHINEKGCHLEDDGSMVCP